LKGGSAFLYHFDYRPACDDVPVKGVYHSAELKFVFDSPVVGNYIIPRYNWTSGHWDKQCDFNTKERQLSSEMGGMWARFAATGHPGGQSDAAAPGGSRLDWDKYSTDTDKALHITIGNLTSQSHYRKDYCDFWDAVYQSW